MNYNIGLKPSHLDCIDERNHESSSMGFFPLKLLCVNSILITGVLLCYFVPQPKKMGEAKESFIMFMVHSAVYS